ncbi:MAG: PDGLE domain-containing protein [Methanotrichaceae archaeon]|nr:PDGLE domain-containing protein [Methanotrichaceae archaeon]
MDKTVRNLAIGLLILIIFVPLGLLAVGETFGEWGTEELQEKLGFVPSGLEDLAPTWSAPIPDYAFPGDESQTGMVAAYYLSAVLGVVICAGLLYFVGKKIARD